MSNERYPINYRDLIVGLDVKVPLNDGRYVPSINFDNAATTPPFHSVLKAIMDFAPWYSSIHRGTGYKSKISSEIYDKSRYEVAGFVNANTDLNTVIYVRNTTEAINKLSNRLCSCDKDSIILSTDMEHHSNDLPWRNKYRVEYINVDDTGRLSFEDLEAKLKRHRHRIKLVTVAGASNVTGYKNPIYKIAELAHYYGTKILVDGAQLVPHCPVNMKSAASPEHIDFLVFSSHKMYSPFGIGVLIGPREVFEQGCPDCTGGGTVKIVTHDHVSWDDPPSKEEAGTPNIMGVVALLASIRTLSSIGMANIETYEHKLTQYATQKLNKISGLKIYGDNHEIWDKVSIIPFNVENLNHKAAATILSLEGGIAVRNGCFCAQPYIQKLLKLDRKQIEHFFKVPDAPRPGMVRISFGLYNTYKEIDTLVNLLADIVDNLDYYKRKYEGKI